MKTRYQFACLLAGLSLAGALCSPLAAAQASKPSSAVAVDQSEAKRARERLALMGVEVDQRRLVQYAAQGDLPVLKLLVAAGVDVKQPESLRQVTALHNGAAQGHVKLCQYLLEQGAPLAAADWRGMTPLINAAYHGRAEVVQLLLKAGADSKQAAHDGNTALVYAVYAGKAEIVQSLLTAGAEPGQRLRAQELAKSTGRQELLSILQAAGGEKS